MKKYVFVNIFTKIDTINLVELVKILKRGENMCESSVYTTENSLIMEDVISIKIEGKKLVLIDILNQKKELTGEIVEMDLEKHKIYVKV